MAHVQIVMAVMAGLALWMLAQEAGRIARVQPSRAVPGFPARLGRPVAGTPPTRGTNPRWAQR